MSNFESGDTQDDVFPAMPLTLPPEIAKPSELTNMRMKSQPFLIPAGADYQRDIDFQARSFVCDNASDSWFYLPDHYRYIPPFVFGYTIRAMASSDVLRVLYQAPPGITNSSGTAGQLLAITAREEDAPDLDDPIRFRDQVFTLSLGDGNLGLWLPGDGKTAPSTAIPTTTVLEGYNGTTYDRIRSIQTGRVKVNDPRNGVTANWSVYATPNAGSVATATRAAPAAGLRLVCTSICCVYYSNQTVAGNLDAPVLRDSTTGAGNILWANRLGVAAAVGSIADLTLDNLWIEGVEAQAMTLEFQGAPIANVFQSVAMTGVTIPTT